MSTSKGTGAAAHEVAALLPPTQLRFLFLRHRPNRALDFDPTGDTLPRLFDDFDRIADSVAGKPTRGELPPDPDRIFALSLPDASADPAADARQYRPPFGHLSLLLQVPGTDVMSRLDTEKGAPLDDAEQDRGQRAHRRRADLARGLRARSGAVRHQYDGLPAAAADLTADQSATCGLAGRRCRADPDQRRGLAGAHLRDGQEIGLPRRDAFGRSIVRSWVAPMDRERAGCWRRSIGSS